MDLQGDHLLHLDLLLNNQCVLQFKAENLQHLILDFGRK